MRLRSSSLDVRPPPQLPTATISRQGRLIHNTSKHINEGFYGRSENIQTIERRSQLEKYFDIGSIVGKGNFSLVRSALRRSDGTKCALKEIEKKSLRGKWFFVENEVEVLTGLRHSAICAIHDAFHSPTHYYLFFEFAQEGDVFEVIRRKGRLEEREAVKVLRQTASALSFLHANSIAHRDVKPENLLLFGQWKVKLCDFGLACTVLGPLTRICGTPTYCAPEVLNCQGVVLHVLLTGSAPFHSSDRAALFRQIVRGQLRFFQSQWSFISSQAKDLIRRILRVNVADRLTSAEVLQHSWLAN